MSLLRTSIATVAGFAFAVGLVAAIPGSNAANEVHLTAAGDYGARPATDTVLTEVARRSPDAHLALGDLAYGDVADEGSWCDYVKARVGEGFPFQLISGNHESDDVADGRINNYSACLPNQIPGAEGTYGREYFVDLPVGNAPQTRLIQVSPGLTFEGVKWAYSRGDSHYEWLSDAIDEARAAGIQWVVVSAHYPCVSVGTNGCVSGRDFYDLMLAKKVDLVLHGHEHAYMRTHQLRSGVPGCDALSVGTADPDCVADSDDSFQAGRGTVFATVGTGGTPLRDINSADAEAGYFASQQGQNTAAAYGLLDLQVTDTDLSASFVGTSGGPFSDRFTIQKGAGNDAPVASFTSSVKNLDVAFDASGSTDVDGVVVDYRWDFGDGATGNGVTAAHTYPRAGSFPVTLTVVDDDGVASSTTRVVSVTDAPTSLAADSFGRTLTSGWGIADEGGAWSTSGAAGAVSVNGAAGILRPMTAGSSASANLTNVQVTGSDLRATVSLDKTASGGGLYLSVIGRRVSANNDYRSKLRFTSNGEVHAHLARTVSGTEVALAGGRVPGLTYAPGDRFHVRLRTVGTRPTSVAVKVWRVGAAEPNAWTFSGSDTTAALQAQGGVGFFTYLSSSSSSAPVAVAFDDLVVSAP